MLVPSLGRKVCVFIYKAACSGSIQKTLLTLVFSPLLAPLFADERGLFLTVEVWLGWWQMSSHLLNWHLSPSQPTGGFNIDGISKLFFAALCSISSEPKWLTTASWGECGITAVGWIDSFSELLQICIDLLSFWQNIAVIDWWFPSHC